MFFFKKKKAKMLESSSNWLGASTSSISGRYFLLIKDNQFLDNLYSVKSKIIILLLLFSPQENGYRFSKHLWHDFNFWVLG